MTTMSDRPSDHDTAHQAAAGALASGVASELIAPLREVRDGLALAIEALDRHFAEAKGPTPYPFQDSKALRERLAEMYIVARQVTRRTADLARAIAPQRASAESVDVNQAIEQALALAAPELGAIEIGFDAGELPAVRAAPGELVLLASRVLAVAAAGARQGDAELAVATTRRTTEAGDEVVVTVRHVGGATAELPALTPLAHRALAPLGGRLRATADGGEVIYEIVVPVR